jgi:hypothetical protein
MDRADTEGTTMIWFFTRGRAQVDFEVRRLIDGETFELVVDYPDGSEGIERFTNPRKLVQRTLTLQRRLIREGWVPSGPGMRFGISDTPAEVPPAPKPRRGPARLWAYVHRQVTERLAATFGL